MSRRSQRHLQELYGYDSTGYSPYLPTVVATPGGSGNVSIALAYAAGSVADARINGSINWGDGTMSAVTGTPMTHHYGTTGAKTITWSTPYGVRAVATPTIT
jgi:hypothetical protein